MLAIRPTTCTPPQGRSTVAPTSPGPSNTAFHPSIDWWQVGNTRYDSTDSLLKSCDPGANGTAATYHFRTVPTYTRSDAVWDHVGGTLAGAAVGGLIGAVGMMTLQAASNLFLCCGNPADPAIMGCGVVGSALGAFVGALAGHADSQYRRINGNTIEGRITRESTPEGCTTKFSSNHDPHRAADLLQYSRATAIPAPPEDRRSPWMDALKGTLIGAATPIVSVLPIGCFAPTVLGIMAGGSADTQPRRGRVLGGILGTAITLATWTATIHQNPTLLLGTFAACTLGGAAAGPIVLPKIRKDMAVASMEAQQWWGQHHDG